ncbi:hypothetical protein [Algoriphagus sp.]|uniref:hypothetical protein n=1 Tax=Algoriphagus sp. TaxID=1872435 RepID=UPI00391930EA
MNRVLILCLVLGGLSLGSCRPSEPESYELKEIPFPGLTKSSLPVLSSDDSSLIFSWVSMLDDNTVQFSYAFLENGERWSEPTSIIKGSDWFVNWADYPAIVQNKGNLLSYILQKSSGGKFSYDVKLNTLVKGGGEWETGLPLHTDSTFTEHGFLSAIPLSDSTYSVTWLDGRNKGGGGHDHSGHAGAMSLRVAEVNLKGKVISDVELDDKTCDCCQTTSALTDQGPVILYRNRSDEEIRDIAITRQVNGKWTEPKIIHADGWKIAGCPVNGPRAAAINSTVLVGWFTASGDSPQVQFAFSDNSGESFKAPVTVEGKVIGRVDVALLDSKTGIVSWMETLEEGTFILAAKINADGKMGTTVKISSIDPSRKSGFPQMEVLGDRVYFAWTEVIDESSTIRTAYFPANGFELF